MSRFNIRYRFLSKYVLAGVLALLFLAPAATSLAKTTNYQKPENWAYLETDTKGPVDIFLVAPTVDFTPVAKNMQTGDTKYRKHFLGALNMERGIYESQGRMFAPYYQQVNLAVYSLPESQSKHYFNKAYSDVKAAFKYYLQHYNGHRPFILAGFSQGSQQALRLLKEFQPRGEYRENLVAAYMIGWRLTPEDTKKYPYLKLAQKENDTGVIVLLNTEAPEVQESLMVPKYIKTYGINPLNWKTDSTPAGKELNLGSCFIGYDGKIKKELSHLTGGYLDSTRGTLKLPDINPKDYHLAIFPDGVYHVYDYQFFYRNLQKNVKTRTDEFMKDRVNGKN